MFFCLRRRKEKQKKKEGTKKEEGVFSLFFNLFEPPSTTGALFLSRAALSFLCSRH